MFTFGFATLLLPKNGTQVHVCAFKSNNGNIRPLYVRHGIQ